MATLTPEQTTLVLAAWVAECDYCHGLGKTRKTKLKKINKRVMGGDGRMHYVRDVVMNGDVPARRPVTKWVPCQRCKNAVRLLEKMTEAI